MKGGRPRPKTPPPQPTGVPGRDSASASVSVSETAATVSNVLILLSFSTLGLPPLAASGSVAVFSSGAFGVAVTDGFCVGRRSHTHALWPFPRDFYSKLYLK